MRSQRPTRNLQYLHTNVQVILLLTVPVRSLHIKYVLLPRMCVLLISCYRWLNWYGTTQEDIFQWWRTITNWKRHFIIVCHAKNWYFLYWNGIFFFVFIMTPIIFMISWWGKIKQCQIHSCSGEVSKSTKISLLPLNKHIYTQQKY